MLLGVLASATPATRTCGSQFSGEDFQLLLSCVLSLDWLGQSGGAAAKSLSPKQRGSWVVGSDYTFGTSLFLMDANKIGQVCHDMMSFVDFV